MFVSEWVCVWVSVSMWVSVCECVCVSVCEYVCEYEWVCECVWVWVCVHVSVYHFSHVTTVGAWYFPFAWGQEKTGLAGEEGGKIKGQGSLINSKTLRDVGRESENKNGTRKGEWSFEF